MERVGIIDIGSNSIRLVIINVRENRAHHQIENLKKTVRLRSGTDSQRLLTRKGIEYASDTISLFVKLCKARQVNEIIAVATAAVRRAPNRGELIERVERETGIKIQVLSEDEEAFLGYIGLINSITEADGLMADLGGGALKLVKFENRLLKDSVTLDFGAVSLMEKFNLQDLPSPENLQRLEIFLEENLNGIRWLKSLGKLTGLGGTFRSLARVFRSRTNYLPDITDGILIPTEAVGEIFTSLSKMTLAQRQKIPGLEKARADLSVAGIGIIYKLLQITNSPELKVSVSSIRDGLFFRYLYPRDPIVFNVLAHQTNNLIDYHNLDENHLRRVSNLAVALFDQLQPLHKLGSWERRLLLIASLMHELGVVIGIENLEKHTLYAVLHSPLRGLSHRERVLTAYLAASHEKLFQANFEDYLARGPLGPDDLLLIKKLAPLLQIAYSLNRSRTDAVSNIKAKLTSEVCELIVFGSQNGDLEIQDAEQRSPAFKKQYGLKLIVTKANEN